MIKQPKSVKSGNILFKFNPRFSRARSNQFASAQKVVDSEVLRLNTPLIPFDKGILNESGILHTVIGSGKVTYKTPYARKMYYNPQLNFQGAPLRGAFWFERMKSSNKEYIEKLAGRKLK